jgi:ribonuclease R
VDFYISKDQLNGAKEGEKVLVEMTTWDRADSNPFAKVVEVFGKPGEHFAEMHAIIAEFGLPNEFPEEVEKYAESIPTGITPEEIAKRRDFRKVTTFTIDPFDAKDFDDAISFQTLPNGNYEIGVHIADVSFYVKPDSILEKEAFNRATSVYLVDRTIPMLPERLSNFLCSLRPNEEKLCYSAVFEMNDKADVLSTWIGRTVIYSDRRFTYEEAQQAIETGQGDYVKEIQTLDKLAKKLREKRFAAGSMDFNSEEVCM